MSGEDIKDIKRSLMQLVSSLTRMMDKETLLKIKQGDIVVKDLAGIQDVYMVVGKVDDDFIYTGNRVVSWTEGWKYRRDNGCEVDEELGSDGIERTMSHLVNHIPSERSIT